MDLVMQIILAVFILISCFGVFGERQPKGKMIYLAAFLGGFGLYFWQF